MKPESQTQAGISPRSQNFIAHDAFSDMAGKLSFVVKYNFEFSLIRGQPIRVGPSVDRRPRPAVAAASAE